MTGFDDLPVHFYGIACLHCSGGWKKWLPEKWLPPIFVFDCDVVRSPNGLLTKKHFNEGKSLAIYFSE